MPQSLQPGIVSAIRTSFSEPDDAAYVVEVLEAATFPMEASGPPARIHMALVLLSAGQIGRFDDELSAARSDWRDTLLRAGLAGTDWRRVVDSRGVDPQDW